MAADINIGDTIRPIDDVGEFVVKKISGNEIIATDEHEFDHHFLFEEVVFVRHNVILQKIESAAHIQKKEISRAIKSRPHLKNQKKNVLEVDLHAGVLLGSTSGLTNHQILVEQLMHARQSIDKARHSGYSYVVLIHGKGKGKLRFELHNMLQGMDKIEFYDASFASYSSGATEVYLK